MSKQIPIAPIEAIKLLVNKQLWEQNTIKSIHQPNIIEFASTTEFFTFCLSFQKRDPKRIHGGFELVVGRLVACCWLLLICSVISLIIVPLDVFYCTFTFSQMSLSDSTSLIR